MTTTYQKRYADSERAATARRKNRIREALNTAREELSRAAAWNSLTPEERDAVARAANLTGLALARLAGNLDPLTTLTNPELL